MPLKSVFGIGMLRRVSRQASISLCSGFCAERRWLACHEAIGALLEAEKLEAVAQVWAAPGPRSAHRVMLDKEQYGGRTRN